VCLKFSPNCHESSIKCLTAINKDRFCSGGNDRYLCIWENSGELVGSIERQEEENLHCLLAISNHRVITGSNSSFLLVYRTDTLKFCQLFTYHRESVRCLANINDELFVSASLDGVIVVWQMESLTPLNKLNYPEKFFNTSVDLKYYAFSVNHLLVLHEQYLAACIGNGFQIYDIFTGDLVMDCPDAHASTVYCIISVSNGKCFLTCSADAQIKLWGNTKDFDFSGEVDKRSSRRRKKHVYPPVCLGEMWGHTDQVKILLKLSETAFASGGHDNLIILWRDGDEQSLLRDKDAVCALNLVETLFPFIPDPQLATDEQDSSSGVTAPETFMESVSEKEDEYEEAEEFSEEDQNAENRANAENRNNFRENKLKGKDESSSEEATEFSENQELGENQENIGKIGKNTITNFGKMEKSEDIKGGEHIKREPKYNLANMTVNNHVSTFGHLGLTTVSAPPHISIRGPNGLEGPVLPTHNGWVPGNAPNLDMRRRESDVSETALSPLVISTMVADKRQIRKVRVPVYIFEFAENLLKEDKLSLEEIRENLSKQGHSSAIVDAVVLQLKQTHGL